MAFPLEWRLNSRLPPSDDALLPWHCRRPRHHQGPRHSLPSDLTRPCATRFCTPSKHRPTFKGRRMGPPLSNGNFPRCCNPWLPLTRPARKTPIFLGGGGRLISPWKIPISSIGNTSPWWMFHCHAGEGVFYPWVFFQVKMLKPSCNHGMFFEKISSVKRIFFCLVDVFHFFVLKKKTQSRKHAATGRWIRTFHEVVVVSWTQSLKEEIENLYQ